MIASSPADLDDNSPDNQFYLKTHSLASGLLSYFVVHAAAEDAVPQAEVADMDLQPAVSGDSQQRGSTPDGTADPEDAAESGLTKSGRKAQPKGKGKLPAGQPVLFCLEGKDIHHTGATIITSRACDVHYEPQAQPVWFIGDLQGLHFHPAFVSFAPLYVSLY